MIANVLLAPGRPKAMTRFDTTRWSIVLRARGEPAEARAALEALCRTYRPPVLAYVRRRGYSAETAEDLAQTFFARFLEQAYHADADPARGRFRAFLLTALKRFLIDADDEVNALKRGGNIQFVRLKRSGNEATASTASPMAIHRSSFSNAPGPRPARIGHAQTAPRSRQCRQAKVVRPAPRISHRTPGRSRLCARRHCLEPAPQHPGSRGAPHAPSFARTGTRRTGGNHDEHGRAGIRIARFARRADTVMQ